MRSSILPALRGGAVLFAVILLATVFPRGAPDVNAGTWVQARSSMHATTASSVEVFHPFNTAGDALLLSCQGRRNSADFSAPGYTTLAGPYGPSGLRIEILHKVSLGGEASVIVANADPVNGWSCVSVKVNGADPLQPLDAAPVLVNGNGASIQVGQVTPASPEAYAIAFIAAFGADEIYDPAHPDLFYGGTEGFTTTLGTDHAVAGLSQFPLTGASTFAPIVQDVGDWWGAITLALKPAAQAPTPTPVATPTPTPTPLVTPAPTPAPTPIRMEMNAGETWELGCPTNVSSATIRDPNTAEVVCDPAASAPASVPASVAESATAIPPTPTPVPPTGCDASGLARAPPTSGMTVWGELEFCETTTRGDANSGYSTTTLQLLQPRPNVANDCTWRDSSERGLYCGEATTWQNGQSLVQHLWTGNDCSDRSFVHKPNDTTPCHFVSGPTWTLPQQQTFAVSFIARFDDIPGRKVAYLRWCGPPVGAAGYCEDNMPEARLEAGPRGFAFHHLVSSDQQISYPLGADDEGIELDSWHSYRLIFRDCQSVTFIVDGHQEGTTTTGVPCGLDAFWVFQAETYLRNVPELPFPWSDGHLYLDWVRFETAP